MLSEKIGTKGFCEITSLIANVAGPEQLKAGNIEGLYLHLPTFELRERATTKVTHREPQLLFFTVCTAAVTVKIGENS